MAQPLASVDFVLPWTVTGIPAWGPPAALFIVTTTVPLLVSATLGDTIDSTVTGSMPFMFGHVIVGVMRSYWAAPVANEQVTTPVESLVHSALELRENVVPFDVLLVVWLR